MTERRSGPSWRDGIKPIAPLAALWVGASAFLLILVRQQAIPYADLLLDPAQYNRRPWYTGLVSNVGVLGWTVAAVAAVGGGWLASISDRGQAGDLLRGGGLLSGLLLLDDLFQLHIIVPRTVGAPKTVFYALYGGLGVAWAVANRSEFNRTRWPLLIAALSALAGSTVIDVLGNGRSTALAAEDSAKFLGILAWALYFVLTVGDIGRSIARQGRRAMETNDGSRPTVLAFDPDQQGRPAKPTSKRRKPGRGPTPTDPEVGPTDLAATETTDAAEAEAPEGAGAGGEHDPERAAARSELAPVPVAPGGEREHRSGTVRVAAPGRRGPTRRSNGVDHLASWWRSIITLWLPAGLLLYLCIRAVTLLIGS